LVLTIYFDQQGVICQKFGIKQVPALITQKDDLLLIQEMKAEDIFQEYYDHKQVPQVGRESQRQVLSKNQAIKANRSSKENKQ
jgi:hypothetical protein